MMIREAQELIKKAYYDRDRARGLFPTFTWLVEEVGELAEAILGGEKKHIEEELADVLAWLLSVANLLDVDIEKAFIRKYVEKGPPP